MIITSGAARARASSRRIAALDAKWDARDDFNSVPTIYTSIIDKLKSQNGSAAQWFANVNSGDVVQTRAQDIDSNFSNLVAQRASTIKQLDSITAMVRQSKATSKLGGKPQTASGANHDEHSVSDGRAFAESRHLVAAADSFQTRESLVSSVLFSFGVPPQVIGKNINSERLASSNRLTERAIVGFRSLVTRVREILESVMRESTTTPKGRYIGYSVVLHTYELNELMPVLHDDAIVQMAPATIGLTDFRRLAGWPAIWEGGFPGREKYKRCSFERLSRRLEPLR